MDYGLKRVIVKFARRHARAFPLKLWLDLSAQIWIDTILPRMAFSTTFMSVCRELQWQVDV